MAIVADMSPIGAAAAGLAAWAARVGLRLTFPPRPRREKIDPFTLRDPWREYVRQVLKAQSRFREAQDRIPPGPLADKIAEIGERVEAGVEEAWRIARDAQLLADARRNIEVGDVRRRLKDLEQQLKNTERDWRDPEAADSPLGQARRALESQLQTAARMDRLLQDSEARLRLLDSRLDEAVARVLELSTATLAGPEVVGPLGEDVESLVAELEALRAALEETRHHRKVAGGW